jgi:hypothetical protein
MNATSGHTIRLLTHTERLSYEQAGHSTCIRKDCPGAHAYYATRRTASGRVRWERLCVSHAAKYANRNGLDLPPLPQRPKDHTAPLPASVVARGADTDSTHGASGRKRWN